jgi:hypothetical protein
VIDLERALTDLAEHLDIPDRPGWDAALRRELVDAPAIRRRSRVQTLVAAAAAIVVLAAGVVAVAPARHAVAGWLGIGAVEIHRSAPPSTVSTTPGSTRPTVPPLDLAGAQEQVRFAITTPRGTAPPARVTVDRRVPGGLVALAYDHFTLVEIATDPSEPTIAKFVDGGPVQEVTVHGHAGMWIPRAHSIGYIDRSGDYRTDTVRRSGPVLLWVVDDVTFRIEGPHTLAEAMAIADTVI